MFDEIVNYRAQYYLRNLIDNLPYQDRVRLKSLRYCNTSVANVGEKRVYLLRNDKGRTSFFGLQTCNNTWICPHCAAKQMQKYRERIAAAIDSMKKQGYEAIMITFTIPHVWKQSFEEVLKVLYDTFQRFIKNAWCKRQKIDGSFKSADTVNRFFHECQIKHYVQVCEVTYGHNGWHPHFHCLFWLPKSKVQSTLQWEETLMNYWSQIARKQYQKHWNKFGTNLDEKLQMHIKKIYSTDFALKNGKAGFYISKDRQGKVLKSVSSDYLTGWTTDNEMTGLHYKKAYKVGKNLHYTPFELLELAMNGDKKAEKLLIEYILTVTKKPVHKRVRFTRTGILNAAKLFLQNQKLDAVLKKKSEESKASWAIFAWFTKDEWNILSCDKHAIENIACLAAINRKDLLQVYLWELFHIPLHDDISPIALMIQNQIYNKQVA